MSSFELHTGDALRVLRTMPDESVHCVVTSPPYWGLRDYGASGQIGLEEDLEEWVERLVVVFREVRRVLRSDGTCWVNLGDSYAQGKRGSQGDKVGLLGSRQSQEESRRAQSAARRFSSGVKHKDLLGQPWLVAFALREDGWFLRSDIVWAKRNSIPESVVDRPSKSHEYLFLLSKSERYFYDADAIREPYAPSSLSRRASGDYSNTGERIGSLKPRRGEGAMPKGAHPSGAEMRAKSLHTVNPLGRNRRSVWTLPTARFREAHFATFPEELVEPCILAGSSSAGCCVLCAAPLRRPVDRREKAWKHSCDCNDEVVPCFVLDPFSGSATTGAVALKLRRRYIGIELNETYQETIARPRLLAAQREFQSP